VADSEQELIPTRATLLARLKDWQDAPSWQDFFDTYWKLIHRMAISGGLTEIEAQEVVQETMLAVAKHMPGFKYDPVIGSFKSWLFNMTRWRMADQIRKRQPQIADTIITEPATNVAVSLDEIVPDLTSLWEKEWEKNLVKATMRNVKHRLDPQKYQIFDFYVKKSWPPEKVAKSLGISVEQVYLAKHRIMEMVRDEMARLEKEML